MGSRPTPHRIPHMCRRGNTRPRLLGSPSIRRTCHHEIPMLNFTNGGTNTNPRGLHHRLLAVPLTVAAAPLPLMRSDRPPKQPSPSLPTELPPSATPGAYRPLQPLPVTTPTLAANPHPQAGVSISMKNEGKLLDEVPSPPAVFSASCNPHISFKEETLLEDGVARERKTVDEEKSTVIVKETILLDDENGLMNKAVNCLHEVSYPSVMVYALTCAGGSEITREEADRENDDIIKRITLIRLCAFDPGICVCFSRRNWEFLAMHMEAMDLQVEDEKLHIDNVFWNALNMLSNVDKELPHGGFMKCLLATKTFNIGLNRPAKPVVFTNVQKFDGDYVRRRLPIWRAFDPGGYSSPTLLIVMLFMVSWVPP